MPEVPQAQFSASGRSILPARGRTPPQNAGQGTKLLLQKFKCHSFLTPFLLFVYHLVAWSANDPPQWFDLHVVNHEGGYAVVLIPDVARSIQRWKARQVAALGQAHAEATMFAVFRPLRFFNSAPSPLWPQIYTSLPDRMMLGFLDATDACWDDPRRTASERIKFIGPFRRGDNAKLSQKRPTWASALEHQKQCLAALPGASDHVLFWCAPWSGPVERPGIGAPFFDGILAASGRQSFCPRRLGYVRELVLH
jgi:hypothetical protein